MPEWNDPKTYVDRARGQIVHAAEDLSHWVERTGAPLRPSASWLKFAGIAAIGFAAGVGVLNARKLGMQATTAVAGDWFAQLKAEHRLAEALFEAGLKTRDRDTAKRTAILAKLAYALTKHALQEEAVIYPALRGADRSDAAKDLAAEHFEIKTFLHDLSEMEKDDPLWLPTWSRFHDLVKEHVGEEEQTVFPAFHGANSTRENLRLTAAMNREGIKLA